MSKDLSEDLLFKALSHPTRRKILRYIASHGEASYSELAMIEPKSGVLYHHLKLLGDLIEQDERKIYRLTEKGYKALEFLENFFEPRDISIHRYLTPRWLLERIEGKIMMGILFLMFFSSCLIWFLDDSHVLIFILVLPLETHRLPSYIIALLSWFGSTILLSLITRIIYDRHTDLLKLLTLNTIPFTISNLSPLVVFIFKDSIITFIILGLIQFYVLMLIISNVSVVARIVLKRATVIVLMLHYLALIIYLFLII